MPDKLEAGPAPIPIVELAEVDSTNAEAMRRAAKGERGPLWISAVRQHAGRGRSGRTWASLDGNLMATLLVEPATGPARLGELGLVAGVAAHQAIGELQTLPGLRLKWPNDVLIREAKLGGILVESTSFQGATVAVVGFGINIAGAPFLPGRATTALRIHGAAPEPTALLHALSARMSGLLDVWREPGGFAAIRAQWLERAGPLGEAITVDTGTATHSGAFAGLDHDGALLMRDPAGTLRRFAFGDVTLGADGKKHTRGPPHGA